jgi:endonuclease/exonuclease/phosphatase family metal-dependent hydrolase
MSSPRRAIILWWCFGVLVSAAPPTAQVTVATWNLENYHLAPAGNRPAKSARSRAKIRECLLALKPDILAIQEIGEPAALLELQSDLKAAGLDLPYREHVTGWDTNIFVGVISRHPIVARRPHTNESFLLGGRRYHASRGFAEVDVQVTADYRLTLLTAHLKSKRAIAEADEAEIREQEALRLRGRIDALLSANPRLNLVVCGDFNDTKDSVPIRTILGRGVHGLIDTRPAERNGDADPGENPRYDPRRVTWTHYYGKEDSYARFDYLLLSRGLAREWLPEQTYVLATPDWGLASDHRPIVGTFTARDE